jgi:hypothetical protein
MVVGVSGHDCDRNGCPCTYGEHMDAMYGAVRCRRCGPTDAEWRDAHLTHLGYEIVRVFRIREIVESLDRLLRRWPWLYRRLS